MKNAFLIYLLAGETLWLLYDIGTRAAASSLRRLIDRGRSNRRALIGLCIAVTAIICFWPLFFGTAIVRGAKVMRSRS